MNKLIFQFGIVLLAQIAFAKTAQTNLPCAYSGKVMLDEKGKAFRLVSDEMKARATHKVDVSHFMGRFDFKSTVIVQVMVSPNGKVICTRILNEQPIVVSAEVEKAVSQWKFKPAMQNGKSVAISGLLEFYLCNISCGKEGTSVSLLH